jgi:hypothetical protein
MSHRNVCDAVQTLPPVAETLRFYGGNSMSETRIAAIALICGVLGLSFGTFDYLQEARAMSPTPVQKSFEDTEFLSVPVWLGSGAIIAGLLLLIGRTKG